MYSEALVEIVGVSGDTVTVSSPGFPSGVHASVDTDVTVI